VLLFFALAQWICKTMQTDRKRIRRRACTGLIAAVLCLASIGGDQQTRPALGLGECTFAQGPRPRHPFPLAGKVKIDGRAPGDGAEVIVMLNGNVGGKIEPYCAFCQADGTFRFHGGHSPGLFVITIARLRRRKGVEWTEYLGPDLLNNLYNDPDENARRPEFVINHKAPGRADYLFDLKVAGVRPVPPGPNALIQLEFE
jgi:hypothetical protein